MISRAEKIVGSENRDIAFLDIAFNVWLKGDFKTSRAVTARITDLKAASQLATLNDFGEGAQLLKNRAVRLPDVESFAVRLPQGIERSLLFLGIANAALRSRDNTKAREAIAQSLKGISAVGDARRPFLTLFAAGQLAGLDPVEAESALANAVKEFNAQDDSALSDIDWRQRVEIGPLVEKFPLGVAGPDFTFEQAFRQAIAGDFDKGTYQAEALRDENLRVRAFVELSRAMIASLRNIEQSKEPLVRVGEDGMRKSASKTVMPVYPEEAIKKGEKGVVVIEVQYNGKGTVTRTVILEAPSLTISEAVVNALKQWKFIPSTLKGEPISVRGKLTFYFIIDENGQGRVENPKQYQ